MHTKSVQMDYYLRLFFVRQFTVDISPFSQKKIQVKPKRISLGTYQFQNERLVGKLFPEVLLINS